MSPRPAEATEVHTRLLKCALEVEDARAYWGAVDPSDASPRAQKAFDGYWFGARSLARVEVLVANLRARFDAYPEALEVLRRWRQMPPDTRTLICHWHAQLADPLYRRFTGELLVSRREALRPEITRDLVVSWVEKVQPARWTAATRIQFASKLLSTAFAAGLVESRRDPRPLGYPIVSDEALTYLLYVLRGIDFGGTLLDNAYLTSVGLDAAAVEDRARQLPALRFRRLADLVEFNWAYPNLAAWAESWLPPLPSHATETAP